MKNDVFLRACRREPTPYTPIWLMRQAGRYQKEYRDIRAKVSFLELCKTPELAAEVTVFAVDQLDVDAGIIFADILLPLEPLGAPFEFGPGEGPKILEPVRTGAQVDALRRDVDAAGELGFVLEAIRQAKTRLDVPLLGFAGAPFTLASYLIEGGGSKNYFETKKLMLGDAGVFRTLMERLVDVTIGYLNAQIHAGADAVQVFDSWVGCLSPGEYATHVAPHMRRLFDGVSNEVPRIHFGTGNPALYPEMARAGGEVIGIDWRADLAGTWDRLGDVALMGNLDPGALLAGREALLREARGVLDAARGRPGHVFNLGHGLMPAAQVPDVQALVAHVKEQSRRDREEGAAGR